MTRPLRVGILLNALTRSEGIAAGGTQRTLRIVDQWRERFECVLFAPAFARPALQKALPGIEFVPSAPPLEPPGRIGTYLWRALCAPALRTKLRRCDVLYASSPFVPDSLLLAIAAGVPSVVLIAHLLPPAGERPGSRTWNAIAAAAEDAGLRIVKRSASAVIALSDGLRDQLRARGLRQVIVLGTSGLDHVTRVNDRSGNVDAVCVARLHPAKGVADLIGVWKLVVARRPGASLVLIGDGEPGYVSSLRAEIRRAGLTSAFVLAGGVDDGRRDELLASSRIFVFPSYEEGWGIALGEAMAAGLPCVTYNLPVFDEIFPRGRIAVPLTNTNAFAEVVLDLLGDDARRARLSAEASDVARRFTWAGTAAIDGACVAGLAGRSYCGSSE